MPSPYRAIFATPGTKGFTAAGLLGRMPLSMVGIGVLTMITELGGSYGLAGALTGTIALSAAAVGPQVSRLVDQYGQRRVLRPATLVAAAAVTGLLIAAANGWPSWTLFPFAVVAGCVPSVGSMVRARWTALFRDTPQLHTAYSFESIVDELCFIIGPPLAATLSAGWFPEAGPVVALAFLLTGVWWLTALTATEPKPHPHEEHTDRSSALRSPASRSWWRPSSRPARSSAPWTWPPWPSPRSTATSPSVGCSWRSGRSDPAWRASSSACCTSKARPNLAGSWASVRWP